MPRQQLYLIGSMNNEITGCKLPSKRDCLSVLFHNMRLVKLNLHESSRLVIDECIIFWRKARIPTHDSSDCTKKLKKLYEDWRKLEKNKTRNTEIQKMHEKIFEEQLDDLFDIARTNALSLIKIEEDRQFLLKQREKGRPGCMLGTDMKLTSIEKRKAAFEEEKDRRKKSQELETFKLTERIRLSSSSSSEDMLLEEVVNEIPAPTIPIPGPSISKRAKRNIMTSRLSAALDKCKISDRDAVHLLTAAAESFQVNFLEFTINRSTIKRAREQFRKQSSEAIKSTFSDLHLNHVVVHWDSKLLPDIISKENIDRLPVIVSALNVEKLLGVPALSSGTGKEISSAVYNLLQDWDLVDKVQAFVFDTTSSHSGRLNGACVLLEQLLNRDVLFFACRHHIFELVLQAVFSHVKVTVMNGPDIPLFKRFKNFWKNIDSSNFRIYSTFYNSHKNLKDISNEITSFCIQKLNDSFPRDDYREFIELVLIFLGGSPPRGIKFRQPGAYHLARWMAKAIYCFKISLFSNQFKITTREQNSLDEVCCFIVKCYIQAWITAPNPVTAPMNDLLFLKKLMNYNDTIGEVAIKKFINHLWYLNEECAVFSIFDSRVDSETKQRMAKKILEGKEQSNTNEEEENEESKKKFNLKIDDLRHFLNKDLPFDLLTNKSWRVFERFKMFYIFLRANPNIWPDLDDYKEAKQIISSLRIVNDAAERGVKLMEEFNQKFSKNEDQKQFTLQVVQEYRKTYSGCSRDILKKTYEY